MRAWLRSRIRGAGSAGARVVVAAAALAALVVAGALSAPRALRSAAAFAVRSVEVEGVRFIDPYAVIRAAGIGPGSSVFDDHDGWRYGVLTLPLVEDVEIRRRLPSGVTFRIREVQPLALAAGPELRPVDGTGRALEIQPAGALLDLPILSGVTVRAGRLGPAGVAAVETVAALRSEAPELADRVSQLDVQDGTVRVLFRDDAVEALLPIRPTAVQVTQLRIAFADLVARGELAKVRRIDLRFRDQVVVSFLSSSRS